tara:strand:- start:1540 stop:2154 length:615 start_codon:yes stop_codon:yes gene_type:complete
MLVDNKILPVLVIHDQKKAIDLAKCLYDSGIRNIEIALRTDSAKKSVDNIVNSQIPMNVGIGTILTVDDLIFAKQVGANFGLSPSADVPIIKKSVELDFNFIPGISTPTDISLVIKYGINKLKFFPAENLGGMDYLNTINSPFKHLNLKYVVLGGINQTNFIKYIKSDNIIGVGGSWIAEEKLIKNNNWNEISLRAKKFLELSV